MKTFVVKPQNIQAATDSESKAKKILKWVKDIFNVLDSSSDEFLNKYDLITLYNEVEFTAKDLSDRINNEAGLVAATTQVEGADSRQYYVVHYGWDEGGPEDGPIFKSGSVVLKARSRRDAESRVLAKLGPEVEECWAEIASPEDIEDFKADMMEAQDEWQSLVDAGLIDPELEAQMAEDLDPNRFKKMTLAELKQYFTDFIEDYADFETFQDWYQFLKDNGSR